MGRHTGSLAGKPRYELSADDVPASRQGTRRLVVGAHVAAAAAP